MRAQRATGSKPLTSRAAGEGGKAVAHGVMACPWATPLIAPMVNLHMLLSDVDVSEVKT